MSEPPSISRPHASPPFEGTITVVSSTSWEDDVWYERERAVQRHLGPLHLLEAIAESSDLHRALAPSTFDATKVAGRGLGRSLVSMLGDFLAGRRYEVEDTVDVQVRVPLFRLHAPPVDGAKVTYSQKVKTSGEAAWEIKVFGTGLGSSVTLRASHTTKYEASNGACKRIFLPVTIRVSRVAIYRRGDRVATGIRTEVSGQATQGGFVNGIELLAATDCLRTSTFDRKLFSIPAKDDTTGAPVEHEETFAISGSFEASLGLKAFDVDSSVKAKVEREQEVCLTFTVPGGHDYDFYAPSGIDGITSFVS